MKDIQGMLYTREIISTVMFWKGKPICHQDLLLANGVNPNGGVMMKIIHLTGNLGVFKGLIMNHTIKWMVSGIGRLTCTRSMISFEMVIQTLKTTVIEDMTNLQGLQGMTATIMHMMIMATSPVFHIIGGRIAMTGIMNMVAIVMILIMKKIAEEIVVGGDVNHAIESETRDVLVGKRIQVRIGNMSVHDHVHDPILDPGPTPVPILTLVPVPNLVDMMIIQNLGLLEVEAIVEVIGKTAMVIIDMIEVRDAGTVMINISGSIFPWYVLNGPFTF
jgi:hypothetical protein